MEIANLVFAEMKGLGDGRPSVCQRVCSIDACIGVGSFGKDEDLGIQKDIGSSWVMGVGDR